MPALEVKRDRMREMAGAHWAQATDVAGALVRERRLPWRTAHQIVGILVRFTEARGIRPRDVTPELVDEASVEYMGEKVGLSGEALSRAAGPDGVRGASDVVRGACAGGVQASDGGIRGAVEGR